MKRHVAIGMLLIISGWTTWAVARQVEGGISGTVVDASGSAVPGAAVSLMLPGGDRPVLSVMTSTEGFFISATFGLSSTT